MDLLIKPRKLNGTIDAIPSKSQAHRILICAALAVKITEVICPATSQDIDATVSCLNALGADIQKTDYGYKAIPISKPPQNAVLNCGESGSTLRFLLPVAGALGVDTTFVLQGRLPQRPMSPLWEEMERMGCRLSRPTENTVRCQGKLRSGLYTIDGSVSSQYITGLLFAMTILGKSQLKITGNVQSKPYIEQTRQVLALFGAAFENEFVTAQFPLISPGRITVEGDWSNGAFFLTAAKLGSDIFVNGLDISSTQGDKVITGLLDMLNENCTIDVAQIPDLLPILCVAAAALKGATFTTIERLRIKESDRIASTAAMLNGIGIKTEISETKMTVFPGAFTGGEIDACNDHRIAMCAAIASTIATGNIIIKGAQCVSKSYPGFWEDFRKLGGNYEQYLR